MYPLYSNEYFDCEATPLRPYWPDFAKPTDHGNQRDILEVPVTVSFNHGSFPWARSLYNTVSNPPLERLRLVGALWQTRLLRKLYLSPEVMTAEDMFPLVDLAINQHQPVLHMFLHSSSLIDNSGGMLNRVNALETVTKNIASLIEHAQKSADLRFCTISEAAVLLQYRPPTGKTGLQF
ncbi:hypothetical protein R0137_06925 [Congregibacter brevis]|uniref:Uncharacterized protein n=1 Tax=Congregibacter brevis TaxID=3081201 RepID=A0ABZ0IJS8_9GAMM|nr:hypothetical protein R0137_06925 [Congregibacter sp. IMCC45268]